jgi:hypothetical protein
VTVGYQTFLTAMEADPSSGHHRSDRSVQLNILGIADTAASRRTIAPA